MGPIFWTSWKITAHSKRKYFTCLFKATCLGVSFYVNISSGHCFIHKLQICYSLNKRHPSIAPCKYNSEGSSSSFKSLTAIIPYFIRVFGHFPEDHVHFSIIRGDTPFHNCRRWEHLAFVGPARRRDFIPRVRRARVGWWSKKKGWWPLIGSIQCPWRQWATGCSNAEGEYRLLVTSGVEDNVKNPFFRYIDWNNERNRWNMVRVRARGTETSGSSR